MASESDKQSHASGPEEEGPDSTDPSTITGFVWRVFGRRAVRIPASCLALLLAFVFLWEAGRAGTRLLEYAFVLMSLAVLAISLFGFLADGYLQWRQARGAPPVLKRRFTISKFQPDRWRVILRLCGPGDFHGTGFIRLREPVDNDWYHKYTHLHSFLLGLDGKDKYAASIDRTGQPWVSVRTQSKVTGELHEQARATFWWNSITDDPPQHVEIEIGYDMPRERRKALLERLTDQLTSLPDVERESPGAATQ